MTADTAAPDIAAPDIADPEEAQPDAAAPAKAPAPPPAPVVTVVLVRHGRSTANTAGILAGRTPGVRLDEHGEGQAAGVADRLAGITIDRLISSPLERCRQTLEPFATASGIEVEVDERFAEVDYGNWAGRPLKDLASEPLWRTVQQHPSAAVFPGGEGLATVSSRAAEAIRDVRLAAVKDQTVLICSHGDVIKAILADALGLHLDCFQRIVVAPASLSVIRYTALRPFVERINDTGDLGLLRPPPPAVAAADAAVLAGSSTPTSDAVPGGVTH
jgi:probable phosphoglycerate mutase